MAKVYYKLIAHNKVRFLIVGGTGFLINLVFLTIFYHILHIPIVLATAISAELALLGTFIGNNFWAFTHHQHISIKKKLIKFHISGIMGLVINISIVSLLVHYAHLYYPIALIVGSITGLVWNYTLYKRFVFQTNEDLKIKTHQ